LTEIINTSVYSHDTHKLLNFVLRSRSAWQMLD
jgi:hypothetical protein